MPRTRRNLLETLGGTGLATLAGCTDVLESGEADPPELDAAALREVERLGSPAIPSRTPAPIASSFLEESESRARELLESVPETMSAESVPNEAVRKIYAEAREDATRRLERAAAEETPLERARSLRHARGSAAMVNGTYEAAVGDRTESAVRSEVESLRSAVESFERAHRYLGGDPGPALVAHATVEQFVAAAARYLDAADEVGRYSRSAPHVGELFQRLESGRASLEAARHLTERYLASLSDPRDFGDVFQQSAAVLTSVVEDRRAEYPDDYGPHNPLVDEFDRNLDETPAEELLSETFAYMHFRVAGARDELDAGRVGRALLEVHAAERNRRALEAATDAVHRGAFGAPTSASEVRETKLAALEAVEAARSTSIHPTVTRRSLTDVSRHVDEGDRYLELGDDTAVSARNAVGQYAFVQFVAREAPDVSAWLLGAVTAALDGD